MSRLLPLFRCLLVLLCLIGSSAATARSPWDDLIGSRADRAMIPLRALPPEARDTLARIRAGGPFPFRRDGIAFQNRERRLPAAEPGFYREYTVITPGADGRGARRIISGGWPPTIYYYTDDHYRSFRRIAE